MTNIYYVDNGGWKLRMARIAGFIALISYMIAILLTWMYANMQGFTYFSAGICEPLSKYLVWSLGFLGLAVAYDHIRIELDRNFGLGMGIRIVGLAALLSYMIVILFTWIYANLRGFMYFSAGEPDLSIKYPEWVLGIIGIIVAIDCLNREMMKA